MVAVSLTTKRKDVMFETTKPSEALLSDKPLTRVHNLGKQVVQQALDHLIESLDADDTIMDSWDEKTVLERIMYISSNLISTFLDAEDEEDYDYDEEDFEVDEEHY